MGYFNNKNKDNKELILSRLSQIIEDSPYKTKTEFCEALKISPQVLGNVQNPNNKNRDIPKSILNGLANLGYNVTWLLYGSGSMRPSLLDQQKEIRELKEEIFLLRKLLNLKEAV